MAKRKIVNVDEDVIKRMIAGDMPVTAPPRNLLPEKDYNPDTSDYSGNRDDEIPPQEKEKGNEPDGDVNDKAPVSRKKKTKLNYQESFLTPQKYSNPRQTTIILEDRVYSSIRKILKITDGVTIANFVNNVLRYHFNEYKEEISGLRRDYMSDLYNDE